MMFRPFWFALQFLTRLPVPASVAYDPALAGRSLLAYPWVGLLLGALLCGAQALAASAPPALAAALLLLLWVLLTGALHLDGWADCADAWVGGHGSRERTWQILKDPHVGSVAVVLLVCLLLLKFAALQSLANREALLWSPVAGRSAALALLLFSPYANPQGLASAWLAHVPLVPARLCLLAVALLIGWRLGWVELLAAASVAWAIRALAMERLGGVSGDVCGAAVEAVETAVLLAAAWR